MIKCKPTFFRRPCCSHNSDMWEQHEQRSRRSNFPTPAKRHRTRSTWMQHLSRVSDLVDRFIALCGIWVVIRVPSTVDCSICSGEHQSVCKMWSSEGAEPKKRYSWCFHCLKRHKISLPQRVSKQLSFWLKGKYFSCCSDVSCYHFIPN